MVKQGDIIWLDFDPTKGSEQKGVRPALVISNNLYNQKTKYFAIVLPITKDQSFKYPLHVELDNLTKTKGQIMCEQIKMIDLKARTYKVIEHIPSHLLDKVSKIVKLMF